MRARHHVGARPLIAVPTYHLPAGRVLDWARGGYAVPEDYVAALTRAGARPVLLPPGSPVDADTLHAFDAVVLAGGGDVDPDLYGAEAHPLVYGVDPVRDAAELSLVRAAVAERIPVLAICRGLQVVNIALGGSLHQHLPELHGMDLHGHPTKGTSVVHDVKVAADTRLAAACGRESLRCISHHHQGVDRLGGGLMASAWSGDGLVEAVEPAASDVGWLLGVQWHPEMSAADDPAQQAVFEELVAVCSEPDGPR